VQEHDSSVEMLVDGAHCRRQYKTPGGVISCVLSASTDSIQGFSNFINIYQNLLVGTVLLSWFPQARGVGALQVSPASLRNWGIRIPFSQRVVIDKYSAWPAVCKDATPAVRICILACIHGISPTLIRATLMPIRDRYLKAFLPDPSPNICLFTKTRRLLFAQPLFNICDPYLNAFRGIIPPIGGIDLSPILAFTLLNVLSSSMGTCGPSVPGRVCAYECPCQCMIARYRGTRRQEQEKVFFCGRWR
jgi:uncharacterized protein YggT (Ycf19 family)